MDGHCHVKTGAMPSHSENRVMPYTAQQMYDLVTDVESYPKFLPWCAAARIRSVQPDGEARRLMLADLVISFKVFRRNSAAGCSSWMRTTGCFSNMWTGRSSS